MTVQEIYRRFCERIPEELREPWDNDGLMCCADSMQEVRRVLVTLDVTEEVVDYALEKKFDLVVSHHPLIFRPLKAVNDDHHVARKVITLLAGNVAVMSFHTRADKVQGGVNDCLCDRLGIVDAVPFGEGGLGRIGTLAEPMALEDFGLAVKNGLNAGTILMSDGFNPVSRVAVVGGDGGVSYVEAAIAAGADTYLSGRIGYNTMEEAAERGINLVEAGHYHTEFPVTTFFSDLLTEMDPTMHIEVTGSNTISLF